MKDFMLIFVGTSYAEMDLSPEEIQQQAGKWMAWQEKMEKAGVLKSGNALSPDFRRISGADRTVTDRASTELKELVGGYYIVTAMDYDAAMAIAQDYPDYDKGGTVEVREIVHYG